MKQLHWTKVADRLVADTMWMTMNDEDVEFDVKEFEDKFSQKSTAKRASLAEGEGEEKKVEKKKRAKVEAISLIDAKRAYNISIALSRFRMSNDAITDAILALDESVLGEEKTCTLLTCCPTADEVEVVMGFDGDVAALGKAEQFFRAIGGIPRVATRIELYLFKLRFKTVAEELETSVKTCERALKGLATSKGLHRLFEIVLALGNHLNGGTRNGRAYGFKINTLTKLANSKTQDNKSTLLHFLVELVNSKHPEVKGFLKDLQEFPEASRLESSVLKADAGKLSLSLRKLGVELQTSTESAQDAFKRTMGSFYDSAAAKGAALAARVAQLDVETAKLATKYGEDAKTLKYEELFQLFHTFRQGYIQAEAQLEKAKKAQEKEREREDRKAAGLKKKKSPVLKAADESGSAVDKVMGNLKKSDANQLGKMVRERRKQGPKHGKQVSRTIMAKLAL